MTGIPNKAAKVRQAMRFLAGAVTGGVGAYLLLKMVGKPKLSSDPGVVVALVAGLSYGLMGIVVGLGTMAPRQGALLLNVQDADELREQRTSLLPSAAGGLLIGIFMLVLALTPAEARGGDLTVWTLAAAACVVGVVAITVATRDKGDELMRQVGLESSALTLHLAVIVLSIWGLLAHLGHVAWLTPLSVIAGLALLYLVAIFWVAGRKGMTAER